jgi:hypothetical protein
VNHAIRGLPSVAAGRSFKVLPIKFDIFTGELVSHLLPAAANSQHMAQKITAYS